MTHPWFAGVPRPRVLAHRGLVTPLDATHGVVENSFAAVAAAQAAGAHYVESDCHLTLDGVVVLFHDADLSRVTGDPRRVDAVTSRELDQLMGGHGGLVTLEQALDAFPDVRFNLDVKAEGAAEAVGRIVAPHGARVLLTSFSDDRRRAALDAAAAAGGGIRPATSAGTSIVTRLIGAVSMRSRPLARRLLRGIDALQVPERQGRLRIVTPRLLDYAHGADVEVHVWTVNDPGEMTRLVGMGVDGIVTDRADVALAALR
ncbi:glycerophosphodiester phosphodiesterase [Microbacterium sp. 4R-513]|uniref:glycerophosphodiester phosphodiesterase family protein n=1 Tax=Microbacterium sp. 4R-513 TaxID=2567934 RepID=UPI0013E197E9|nr:glycerophosphodiester phosphodiesterase family protein [Microbacterium sp. 4R-513]QIG40760.1 glycerophosphodiester phosphodiesterase [Microbacterium sp. 4R-513]